MADTALFLGIPSPGWSAILAALALLISYTVARFAIRNKQVDFLLYDHKQFDALQEKRTDILVQEKALAAATPGTAPAGWTRDQLEIEAEVFFERFWSLQFDSYIGWFEGYIPTHLYKFWLFSRWRELSKPSAEWTLAGRTLRSSLARVNDRWHMNPDPKSSQTWQVHNFVNLMLDLGTGRTVDIDELLKKYGPPWWLRWSRRFLGAY